MQAGRRVGETKAQGSGIGHGLHGGSRGMRTDGGWFPVKVHRLFYQLRRAPAVGWNAHRIARVGIAAIVREAGEMAVTMLDGHRRRALGGDETRRCRVIGIQIHLRG